MSSLDAIVIGAGISGMTAAYALHRAGQRVCVLEAGSEVGGLIRSVNDNGFFLEYGPQTFPGRATELLAICRDLGLDPLPANPLADKRYLYLKSALTPLPTRPEEAIFTPLLSWSGKWRVLQECLIPPIPVPSPLQVDDISIADFVRARLGSEVLERLVDPFISGIYAGDVEALSLPAVFPTLRQWEREKGSLLKGAFLTFREARNTGTPPNPDARRLFSFKGGMQRLPQTLKLALPRDTVRYNAAVQAIHSGKGGYHVEIADGGGTLSAPRMILAVPAYVAARLLHPFSPLAADALAAIPYVSLSVVHTAFLKSEIDHLLDGFGFLVPRRERLSLLGSVWISRLFPERAMDYYYLFTNYMGGAHRPDIADWDEERLVAEVSRELSAVFRTRNPLKAVFSRVVRHEKAIPQYTLGHRVRLQTVDWALAQHPGITLCGNYLHGIALNECVKSGLRAAGVDEEGT